jgi:hypothetical protein
MPAKQSHFPVLVICLEEKSARVFLESFLPRLFPDFMNWETQFIVFEGKSDMNKRLERRVRCWLRPRTAFVVLRDQDSGDCAQIKTGLAEKCENAGHAPALIRIACRELESWYLGQLAAVDTALETTYLGKQQNTRKFRLPDDLGSPSHELDRITKGVYQKVGGSREIGKHLSTDTRENRSHSFGVFVSGIQSVIHQMFNGDSSGMA